MKYNMLEILGEKRENGRTYWFCRCDCGNEKWIRADSIKSANTASCGCKQQSAPKDLSGKRFGKLIALSPTEKRYHKNIVWECRCDCGNIVFATVASLNSGQTKSCGCIALEVSKKTIRKAIEVTKENIVENTNVFLIQKSAPNANNTSGYRGVTYDKRGHKWIAQIQFQKRMYHLGRFNDPKDAADAYKLAKDRLHGEFLDWYKEYKKEKDDGKN